MRRKRRKNMAVYDFLSIYDIGTDSWTHGGPTAPDTPGPARSEGGGGTVGGLHYSIGGRAGVPPTGDTVMEFAPGGAVYVFGGIDGAGAHVPNTQIFDIAANVWFPGAP